MVSLSNHERTAPRLSKGEREDSEVATNPDELDD